MKRMSASLLCLLLAATAIFTTSCAMKIQATELSAGYTRTTTDPGEVTDAYLAATLDFSLKLFRETVTEDETNDLFSPYSALLCLGLVANGTAGTTREQIENTLGLSVEELNRGLYAFGQGLYSAKDCKVTTANSAWYIDNEDLITVKPSFLQNVADWYNAEQYAAPFDDTTLQDINNWGKEKTDGLIEEFLKEIPPDAVMYLVNALLFDAKWEEPYEKDDVRDWTFHNADGTESPVEMLCSEESGYLTGEGFTGFAKRYKGNRYAFVGLLPNEGSDVYTLLDSLNGETWRTMWQNRGGSVTVKFPEFTYEGDLKLKDPLSALGMSEMFDPGAANFSELGSSRGYTNFYCSAINQKTYIEVNRNGTKAAAITWGEVCGNGAPMEEHFVTLERPFLYAIVDCQTGFPLFLGAVSHL